VAAAPPEAGAADATPDPAGVAASPGAALTITGTGAMSDCPHDGQTIQAGSSTILLHFWHRFGANGSS